LFSLLENEHDLLPVLAVLPEDDLHPVLAVLPEDELHPVLAVLPEDELLPVLALLHARLHVLALLPVERAEVCLVQ
jgi:hypothetical protein